MARRTIIMSKQAALRGHVRDEPFTVAQVFVQAKVVMPSPEQYTVVVHAS